MPAKLTLLAASFLALSAVACRSNLETGSSHVVLNGAGSTFINPVMSRWTQDFSRQHSNIQINYQSIGSGGGVQQVKAGTVDFGASDYPLTDQALSGMKPVLQIPESAGPVCITYNLPGLSQPIKLSAESLAGIYLGKITSWQDPAIAKENPGVQLPGVRIVVAHRTDGSGTTAAFTTYLSVVSPEWKSRVGTGGSVSWPAGVGGKGSEGVTATVKQSPGGIGYVELTYAQQNQLPIASIRNLAGNYIAPSTASTTAAIDAYSDQLTKDPRIPIVNPPASAPQAYPVSTLTFLIIPKDGGGTAKRKALKSFVGYVVSTSQSTSQGLNYAPLAEPMRAYDRTLLDQMTVDGKPIQ